MGKFLIFSVCISSVFGLYFFIFIFTLNKIGKIFNIFDSLQFINQFDLSSISVLKYYASWSPRRTFGKTKNLIWPPTSLMSLSTDGKYIYFMNLKAFLVAQNQIYFFLECKLPPPPSLFLFTWCPEHAWSDL